MMKNKRLLLAGLVAGLGAGLWLGVAPGVYAQTATPPDSSAVLRHYAVLVQASYTDTLAAALEMQQHVQAFLAAPSAERLAQARKSWREAREWYGQTEAFRFYGGPIDDDKGPEGRLNSWPLDESYIDYVQGRSGAGIVGDGRTQISKAVLSRLNERGGEENIAAGWHAIEFLLWGQDLDADGPGARPFSDYVDGKAPNADRRRQYLGVATELLIDDLRSLVDAWAPQARNYREDFERGGQDSLRAIIVGLGSLSRGELAGERMEVALNTQDQEDEHSCFSDNTHRDIVNNALGIQNVWLGRFARRDGSILQGASLRDLVAARDAALAERSSRQIAASVAAARAIQPPFDRETLGGSDAPGPQRVRKAIDSLVAQSKDLVAVAASLGITRLTLATPQ
jgi:putative iron-regulated protein